MSPTSRMGTGRWRHRPYRIVGAGTEYCPGYFDQHGQWNNGFDCPKWGGPNQQYCCGSETHHYCCPVEEVPQKLSGGLQQHVPLIICLTIGGVVLLLMATVVTCYFCSCCWAYKRRKRLRTGLSNCTEHHLATDRGGGFAVNYSVCPDRFFSEMTQPPRYPADDPPPYPGEEYLSSPSEDKEPLPHLPHLPQCQPCRIAGVIPLNTHGGSTSRPTLRAAHDTNPVDSEQPSTSQCHVPMRDWRTMSRDSSFDFAEHSVMGGSHFQNLYARELEQGSVKEQDESSPESLRHYRTA